MIPAKSYLHQIAMVQSQCEPKKLPNIPAAIFHRSPLRERQNKNISNHGTPNRNTKKIAISPYRRRQSNSNIININSNSKISHSKRKSSDPECEQHVGKTAKFMIQSEGQIMNYCQKCAIQLASQGFKVERISSCQMSQIGQADLSEFNPRKKQLDDFVRNIQALITKIQKRKATVDVIIRKQQAFLNEEIEKVEDYYSQFYQIIDEHKSRVLQELKHEYNNETSEIQNLVSTLKSAKTDSEDMKEQIIKLEKQILQAEEREYRPCMNQYVTKVRNYNQLIKKDVNQNTNMKRLIFHDSEEACQMLIKCMNIEWEEEEQNQVSKMSQVKEADPLMHNNLISQQSTERHENPIQFLEKEEKKQQSNIKTLGNLFSSFED